MARLTPYEEQIEAQATQELCDALVRAWGDVMKRHGEDPHGVVVMAAGFSLAIRAIEKEFPAFGTVLRELIKKGAQP
jgi:hypothetical protein